MMYDTYGEYINMTLGYNMQVTSSGVYAVYKLDPRLREHGQYTTSMLE